MQTTTGVSGTGTTGAVNDTNPANNTATFNVIALLSADVTTRISVPAEVSASLTVSGSISFANIGGVLAANVSGTVTFPIGVLIQVIPAGAYTATVAGFPAIIFPSTMTGLGSVNPGVTTTHVFSFRTPGLIGNYQVTSTVVTTTPETNTANNVAVAPMLLATVLNNASLSGRVFQDISGNKIFDRGIDLPIANFRVEVVLVTGTSTTVYGSATTDANGFYLISNLKPRTGYSIRFFDGSSNFIFGTPFNSSPLSAGQQITLLGNASTGTNTATGPVTPGLSTPVAGLIDNVTLYAGDNVEEQNLPLNPSGVVYDSVTRQPIAGATVKLVYEGSGAFSPSSQLLSGMDTVVTGINGFYQYLFINNPPPGIYRFEVTPPSGYLPPQAVLGGVAPAQGVLSAGPGITTVQPQGGPPALGINGATPVIGFAGGAGTQYFLRLQLNFPGFIEVVNNNIPLDQPGAGALLITKTGDKTVAELGDSVQYTIRIRNTTITPIANVKLNDLLPAGFKYILGTSRLAGIAIPNPDGGVGRELNFVIGSIAAQSTVELTYFVRLGVGSQQGDGINKATASFIGSNGIVVRSNTAMFKVTVQGGVFSNEGCITGKVYIDCDGNSVQNNVSGNRELGIPGVRLIMLDGTFMITDSEGKYSLCGVKPQTHVIKVDKTTLPKGSRLVPSSNRNAGVGDSIFVDLKGGELARADFIEGSCSPEVLELVKARRSQGEVNVPTSERAAPVQLNGRSIEAPQQVLPTLRQQDLLQLNPGFAR
ncbi:MAG: DUF11 domain-containing protein [Chitinophagaceae bacterium]|nr:DUF11 domain-containing protein [Polaromonas sp.]